MEAVLLIDFINEIVHDEGKLSGKGYAKFAEATGWSEKMKVFIQDARNDGSLIIHCGLGFRDDYSDHPATSPLLGAAKDFGILKAGTWSTDFVEGAQPASGETRLTKTRISAFFGTGLEELLRERGVEVVKIAGVATDIAVESAARDAHDRGFAVVVLSDLCLAANEDDHSDALRIMAKFAVVE